MFTIPPFGVGRAARKRCPRAGPSLRRSPWRHGLLVLPRRVGETHSGFMVLVEKSSGRILGARALGPHADDAIKIFAMAMRTGATAASLKEMLFAYPTAGSAIPYMV